MSPSFRQLGQNGPQVNAIGWGAMSIGGVYGPAGTDEERFRLLDRALDLGLTFWDTADAYYDSEDVIGKWFSRTGKRNDVFIATKFGLVHKDGETGINSTPEYAKTACESSLKRLSVESIDLYYCHRVDGITPIEKTVEAMAELKSQGKIKYLGLSEVSSNTLRRAHAVHPITAVQIEYSPFSLDIEHPEIGLLQTCRELGVAVVAYSPMGRGLLAGIKTWEDIAADPFLSTVPKYSKENFPKSLQLVEKIKEIAAKKGCTPAQLSLAWVMAQGSDIIPIPGTRNPKYLEENFKAQEVTLTPEEVQEIREASKKADVQGSRYPEEWGAHTMFGDTPAL
ncbi:NADP-dependent oxidoreductase domain-containing protein [Xylariales sp. PMI_506]|nr:NADP-dependent oxidoreductase domain-containing protein [Xylariales sp. PMI_506]